MEENASYSINIKSQTEQEVRQQICPAASSLASSKYFDYIWSSITLNKVKFMSIER